MDMVDLSQKHVVLVKVKELLQLLDKQFLDRLCHKKHVLIVMEKVNHLKMYVKKNE